MVNEEKGSMFVLANLFFIVLTILLLVVSKFIEPQVTFYAALLTAYYTFLVIIQLLNALGDSPIEPVEAFKERKDTAIKYFNRIKSLVEVKVTLAAIVLFIGVLLLEVISLYVIPVSDFYLDVFYGFTVVSVVILWSFFIVFFIVFLYDLYYLYKRIIKRTNSLREPMIMFCIVTFLLLFILTALAPEITRPIAVDHYAKSGYFENIINEINGNSTDDVSRVQAILKWQNENMHNEYHNAIELIPTSLCITITPPYTIYLRSSGIAYPNPEWALISKYGNCGEAAQAFMALADTSNITVRCISLNGEDHAFDEVYMNGTWITVDAVGAVNGWDGLGYDMPTDTYEDGWKYDIVTINAFYPNGTTEDVTCNSPYMNVYNLTIHAVDTKNKPVSNASVWVWADNEQHIDEHLKKYVNIRGLTDNNGMCNFTIGQNNYTIQTNKNCMYFNTTNISLSGEDKNLTVVL